MLSIERCKRILWKGWDLYKLGLLDHDVHVEVFPRINILACRSCASVFVEHYNNARLVQSFIDESFHMICFCRVVELMAPDAVWRHKGSAPSVWEMQKELRRLRLEIKALAELVSGVFEMEDKNSRPGDGEVSDLKPQSLLTKEDKLL